MLGKRKQVHVNGNGKTACEMDIIALQISLRFLVIRHRTCHSKHNLEVVMGVLKKMSIADLTRENRVWS